MLHDMFARHLVRLRLEGGDDAVAQHIHADRLDVLRRDVAATESKTEIEG